jgi:hypothetical protein
MDICWGAHLFARDISLAFRLEARDDGTDVARLTINDDDQIGPVALSCSSAAELVLLLGTAIQILTNMFTLERCVTLRFLEIAHGKVEAWVTLGTREPLGPFFPSEASGPAFGVALGTAICLLQQARDAPRPSVAPPRP